MLPALAGVKSLTCPEPVPYGWSFDDAPPNQPDTH